MNLQYKGFALNVTSYEGHVMGEAMRSADSWVLCDIMREDLSEEQMLNELKITVDDYEVQAKAYRS